MPFYPPLSSYGSIFISISSYLNVEARDEFSRGKEFDKDSPPDDIKSYCTFNPFQGWLPLGTETDNSPFDPGEPVGGQARSFSSVPLELESEIESAIGRSALAGGKLNAHSSNPSKIEASEVASLKVDIERVRSYLSQLLELDGQRRKIAVNDSSNLPSGIESVADAIYSLLPGYSAGKEAAAGVSVTVYTNSGGLKTCTSWLINDFKRTTLEGYINSIDELVGKLDSPLTNPTQPLTGVSLDEPGTVALLERLENIYQKINNENYIMITRLYDIMGYVIKVLNRIHEVRAYELKEARIDSKQALVVLGSPDANFYFEKEGADPEAPPEERYELYALSTNEFLGKILRDYQIPIARVNVEVYEEVKILRQHVEEIVLALGGKFVSAEEWEQLNAQRKDE